MSSAIRHQRPTSMGPHLPSSDGFRDSTICLTRHPSRAWPWRRRADPGRRQRDRSVHACDGPRGRAGGRVIGIERDAGQLEEARRQAACGRRKRPGRAQARRRLRSSPSGLKNGVPSTWSTPATCSSTLLTRWRSSARWLVPLRPGGRIVLADDDHDILRLWPEPPGLARSGKPTSEATIGWETTLSSAAAWSAAPSKPVRSGSVITGCFSGAARATRLFPISSKT